MTNKKFVLAGLLLSGLILWGEILAQEEAESEEVKIDTEIEAEDLGVKEARVLPGSFFYGFKNFFREAQETFTRDPVKKAEAQLRHANEKMVEVKQLMEKDNSEKSAEIAAGVISGINKNFERIVQQSDKLKQAKAKDSQRVEKFLDKIADQSLKQQVVLQRLQERVPEKVFAKIEQSRQEHLEKFGQVMTKVSENPEELAQRLPRIIENRRGSDFKELKAVEILRDLEDKVPEEAKEALRQAQVTLSQKFEQRFAAISPEVRKEKLQNYVESLPGNAVRQFEAFDRMRESFQSEGMAEEMELAKDKALQKFENQFSRFQGQEARQAFMRPWREGSPEALRTMTEMEMRLEPNSDFQQFRQEAQNNFRERFSENPEELRQNRVFQRMGENPDIVDLKMSQDLVKIFSPSEKEPIQGFMRDFQEQTTQKFIDNVSSQPKGEGFFGPPVPGGLKVLEEIKSQVPFQGQPGLNRAMEVQTQTMERHLEQIENPSMFERYKQQIEGDSAIKQRVQQFGQPNFFQKIEERAKQMEKAEPQLEGRQSREGQAPAGETGGAPRRPIVPMTQERVELFKDRQIEQRPLEQKPVEQLTPQPIQQFQQPIQQSAPAPSSQSASPEIFPKF